MKYALIVELGQLNFINLTAVKINLLKFRFIESLRHTAILKNLNFCANSAKKKYQLNRNEKFVDKSPNTNSPFRWF